MAVFLFGKMGSSRVDIHAISYRASISACEKGAKWEMAMNLLGTMGSSRVGANAISYGAAISDVFWMLLGGPIGPPMSIQNTSCHILNMQCPPPR
eukprot:8236968-Prorocentrum_lima.AAC.1